MSDNYPVLVPSASLPSIREQAVQVKAYLADDANTFDGEWLDDQRRKLDAVHSYVRDKKLRAELSHCQRWVELRIGEWLGPAKHTGRPKDNSLPGNELSRDINDRHKQEFRFMAEHKEIVTDIMKNQPGREITRACQHRQLLILEGQGGVSSGSSHCASPRASRSVNLRF